MRSSACVFSLLLAAGCAGTPEESIVWSDRLARSLERERGDVIEVARFSRLRPGAAPQPWEPFFVVRGNAPTEYRVAEVDGTAAVRAEGREGGSGLWRKIRVDPLRTPILEWRWRVPRPAPGSPPLAVTSSHSPMARLSLAFHGDADKLDVEDRAKLRMAKALTVHGLPYASLLYVWMMSRPVDSVLRSPHTDRVRMIVVESGAQRAGEWVTIRRNVVEDFRRAFDEEPGDIVSVGLMTDHGDDGSPRRAVYGDITLRSAP
jgi:hypothetical protein